MYAYSYIIFYWCTVVLYIQCTWSVKFHIRGDVFHKWFMWTGQPEPWVSKVSTSEFGRFVCMGLLPDTPGMPGMPGTFSPPPRFSYSDMHHGTCVMHVPWCMPVWLTRSILWSRRWRKHSRHSRRMRNMQFCVSGKWPIWVMWPCVISITDQNIFQSGGSPPRSNDNNNEIFSPLIHA